MLSNVPCAMYHIHQDTLQYLEMDIGMEDLRLESHIWCNQRVLLRDLQDNLKHTTLEGGIFWALQKAIRYM